MKGIWALSAPSGLIGLNWIKFFLFKFLNIIELPSDCSLTRRKSYLIKYEYLNHLRPWNLGKNIKIWTAPSLLKKSPL